MKKVIAFGLWGNNPTYTIGAIRNAEDAKTIYPDFECWFYIHVQSVPIEIIKNLNSITNTRIIFKNGDLNDVNCLPMMWRFEPIDDPDVEVLLSRDTDTRFLLREKLAVYEWLNSNKTFHIMRDHPHHGYVIMGGMFGTKKIAGMPSWINKINSYKKYHNRDYDQHFLRDFIYPLIKDDSIIHASFHKIETHAINFPINYEKDYKFVGEYVYADESRSRSHIDDLIRSLPISGSL